MSLKGYISGCRVICTLPLILAQSRFLFNGHDISAGLQNCASGSNPNNIERRNGVVHMSCKTYKSLEIQWKHKSEEAAYLAQSTITGMSKQARKRGGQALHGEMNDLSKQMQLHLKVCPECKAMSNPLKTS